jgi:hypothetical protein
MKIGCGTFADGCVGCVGWVVVVLVGRDTGPVLVVPVVPVLPPAGGAVVPFPCPNADAAKKPAAPRIATALTQTFEAMNTSATGNDYPTKIG